VRAAVRELPVVDRALLAVRWASRRRLAPVSRWGFERGTPVDRWYIERFLDEHRDRVRGRTLEVLEDLYGSALGADVVDVVDIDAANPAATIVGDLCDAATLPRAAFDAVVLTQTLQFLADPRAAVRNVVDALRPGGTLLLTVPSVSRVADGSDRWRWTPAGLRELLAGLPGSATVQGAGNLVACRAFLMGAAVADLPAGVLDRDDPAFPLVVLARLDKPVQGG
jgi:SAM-dependent methyltransferase